MAASIRFVSHIAVSGLAYAHPGGELLFSDVSFRLPPGRHAGLIGANGVGKSTLLRILAGELSADDGDAATGGEVGYMPQDVGLGDGDRTVRELLLSLAPSAVRQSGEAMIELEAALTAGDDAAGMRLGTAIADYSSLGGYELEGQWDAGCRQIVGVPFSELADRPARTLSGGERKQLVLELLFGSDADVLLLDEPDNFLDVPAKLALERRVRGSRKTILMISHDREVLAAAVDAIVTLEGNGAWVHGESYATYARAREDAPAPPRRRRQALEGGGAAAVSADEDVQGARPIPRWLGQARGRDGDPLEAVSRRRTAAGSGHRPADHCPDPRRRLRPDRAAHARAGDRSTGRAVRRGDPLRRTGGADRPQRHRQELVDERFHR